MTPISCGPEANVLKAGCGDPPVILLWEADDSGGSEFGRRQVDRPLHLPDDLRTERPPQCRARSFALLRARDNLEELNSTVTGPLGKAESARLAGIPLS